MRIFRLLLATIFTSIFLLTPVNASSEFLVIGIDVSGSMSGQALQSTVNAAESIVKGVENQREIEIYTFTRSPKKLDEPTSLLDVTSGGYTALFDSIWALALRARELGAPLIVLTDGKESRSLLTSSELIKQLDGFPVSINFIAYNPLPEDEEVLKEISSQTGGTVYGVAEADELLAVFQQAVTEVVTTKRSSNSTFPIILSTLIALISFLFMQLVLKWRRKEKFLDSWSNVLEDYKIEPNLLVEREKKRASRFLSELVGDTSVLAPRIKGKIEREGLLIGAVLVEVSILLWFGLSIFAAIPVALLLTALLLKALIRREYSSAKLKFESELPASLRLIASSLTAGLSFLQALDSFSSEGNTQVAREFRRALSEIQMGSPVERALSDVAERMNSEDLKWVVFAFSVQREVGGGLAKILQTSAEAIDTRANLRQEIRTLSTETSVQCGW